MGPGQTPLPNEVGYRTACGGKLKDPTHYPSAVFHGERVYFCIRACLHTFERDPESFMSGEIEHPKGEE
jgi:YHS domain-containing protein